MSPSKVSVWAAAEDRPLLRFGPALFHRWQEELGRRSGPLSGWQALLCRWRALPAPARDAIVTVALTPVVLQPGLGQVGAVLGDLEPRPLDPFGVLLLVALWAPLAIRRRWPALSLAVIGSAFAVHELLGYPGSAATLALFVASYSAGAHQRRYRTAVIVLAAAGCGLTSLLLVRAGSPTPAVGFLAAFGFLAACWTAGAWTRARQQNAELRRRSSVEAALAAERARIARELHDVVTHHVTAMVVQADAAQFVVGDAPVATGLAAISDTGRLALADLRHLLGVLGPDGDARPAGSAERTPAVGPIRELVEQARRNGQPVELMEDGAQPARPGGAELAAYRVVQEALTNALKHAPGRATTVWVRHSNEEAEIEVLTQGPGSSADRFGARPGVRAGDEVRGRVDDRLGARSDAGSNARSDRREFSGSGRGLTGMRERVAVFGGELAAGPTPDGGFQVRARIPRGSDS